MRSKTDTTDEEHLPLSTKHPSWDNDTHGGPDISNGPNHHLLADDVSASDELLSDKEDECEVEDSPYPEVRAAAPNFDGEDLQYGSSSCIRRHWADVLLPSFKNFGYVTISQALDFVADLKFGHYMKLPPRITFVCQLSATLVSCLVQILVLNMAIHNVDDICNAQQPSHFTCPGGRVFFSCSCAPFRMNHPPEPSCGLALTSGHSSICRMRPHWAGPLVFTRTNLLGMLLFSILGAIVTIAVHLASRRYSPAKDIIVPLVLGGAGSIPPATPLNYLSLRATHPYSPCYSDHEPVVGHCGIRLPGSIVKTHHLSWWSRLNYLTSSGLDLGLAMSTTVIFALNLAGVHAPKWWGNTVPHTTMDSRPTAVQVVLHIGEKFGPEKW